MDELSAAGQVCCSTYLHTETAVNLDNAIVVFPDNAELEDTLRDLNDVEGLLVFGVGL